MLSRPDVLKVGLWTWEGLDRSQLFTIGAYRFISDFQDVEIRRISDKTPTDKVLQRLSEGALQGLMISLPKPEVMHWLEQHAFPCVVFYTSAGEDSVPTVNVDEHAVGRLAAEYFLRMGYSNFAYAETPTQEYSNARKKGFVEAIQTQGYEPVIFDVYGDGETGLDEVLQRLPRPCAMYCCWDHEGVYLVRRIRKLGLRVPDDFAVLGTDNDRIECFSVYPNLSSISLPSERLGYEAMRLLMQQLRGEKTVERQVILPPVEVVQRLSTSVEEHESPAIRSALAFIRQQASQPIRVGDVCRAVKMSRRGLEEVVREQLDRSVLELIQESHLNCARELLLNTTLPIKTVAYSSGFNSPSHFSRVFRQQMGMNPQAFRQQFVIDSM